MAFLIIIIALTIAYASLILYYWRCWNRVPVFQAGEIKAQTRITILIPARNEESNIRSLLQSLENQSYPEQLFDVMVIDDHSTDSTAKIVKDSRATLIHLNGEMSTSHKKKAIETGVNAATGEFIITTDADCVAGRDWIRTMSQFKEKHRSAFIAAPVRLSYNTSWLEKFQAMDFMVLQGITAAVVHKKIHSMANGANLGYEKDTFREVNGFSGIDGIASGDDMLLMHKIRQKHPDRVHYLKAKEAIITSKPMSTWKEFLNQRIRWASKTFYYKDRGLVSILALVYAYNLSFIAMFIAGFFGSWYWILLPVAWIIKTLVEWPFVASVARFYDNTPLMKYFFLFQPFHILYTVFAGLLGQFGKYEWKGRRVR